MKGAQMFLDYNEPARNEVPEVWWFYGSTGVGKTQAAYRLAGREDVYQKTAASKWMQGYDAQRTVIFDDVSEGWWDFKDWLGLLDSKGFRSENKGGIRQFRANRIFITSIVHPAQIFTRTPAERIGQLIRRITHLENFDDPETFRLYHPVPDVPEVRGVIMNPLQLPPVLVRQPNLWGHGAFGFAYPQDRNGDDMDAMVVSDSADTIIID